MADADTTPSNATPVAEVEQNDTQVIVKKSARVALPEPPTVDSDEDDGEEGDEDDGEVADEDILADWPAETEEIELIHSKLRSLSDLGLSRFARHLKKLCLRQNFISVLDEPEFHQLTKLEELDFYDNKIKHVGGALDMLENLSVLDLSFNLLRAVPDVLERLTSLRTVYFVQNRIAKISGLQSSVNLRSLELGGNKIRKIENLDALVNLEELWLGKNKITVLENLGNLKKLKILSLQSNRITKLENLEALEDLEELYLSHNGVKRLEGLEQNTKLKTLDVGNNFIPAIENLVHLKQLEELWMNGNAIPDLRALDTELQPIPTLTTVYLEGNPCQKADMTGYRRKIMLALKQLKQIDATYVRAN